MKVQHTDYTRQSDLQYIIHDKKVQGKEGIVLLWLLLQYKNNEEFICAIDIGDQL